MQLKVLHQLRIPLLAFFAALTGFLINCAGWYVFESRLIALTGFAIGAIAILAGFIGIAIGQISVIKALFVKDNGDKSK
jgi:hypothetical protein